MIQNSKKKGPEYGKEFGNILLKAFEHMSTIQNFDEKSKKNLERVLNIWEERGVYDPKQIAEFKKALGKVMICVTRDSCELNELMVFVFIGVLIEPAPKKKKPNDDDKKRHKREKYSPIHVRERKKSETETEIEIDGMKEVHVTLSPHTPAGDPPEPDEIIKALMVCIFRF